MGTDFDLPEPLVVLTGAGVSAESGVPTFRGAEGMWRSYRPQDLATPEAFERHPTLVWQFYSWRRELLRNCSPNLAHRTLAEIESHLDRYTLITQNVDGLHQSAGSRAVLELHGSLNRTRCSRCGRRWDDRGCHNNGPPACRACGGSGRPDVVWFGEALPAPALEAAWEACAHAATMWIIGTSGLVYPAAELPRVAQRAGARLIEFNLEPTPLSPLTDEHIFGPAADTLPDWWQGVRGVD